MARFSLVLVVPVHEYLLLNGSITSSKVVQANYVRSGRKKVILFLPLIQVEVKGVRIMKLQTKSSWIRQHNGKASLVCSPLNIQSKLFTQKRVLLYNLIHIYVILRSAASLFNIVLCIFQNSDHLGGVGRHVGLNAPFLVVCQTAEGSTMHVIVEQEPMCELTCFSSALIHLVASYFLYNIEYPKVFRSLPLMIQHHVLGLPDKQRDPTSVVEVVTSLQRMDSTF